MRKRLLHYLCGGFWFGFKNGEASKRSFSIRFYIYTFLLLFTIGNVKARVSSLPGDVKVVSVDSLTNRCPGTYTVYTRIQNDGSTVIYTLDVNWSVNGVLQTPVTFNGSLDTIGGTGSVDTTIALGNVNLLTSQSSDIKVWTTLPNSNPDPNPLNDTAFISAAPSLIGTYTVDPSGSGSHNFSSFGDIVSELQNKGICGPVTVNVAQGVYHEQVSIGDIDGVSQVNTITFRPASSNTDPVILSDTASQNKNYIWQFKNASYIYLKGFILTAIDQNLIYGYGGVVDFSRNNSYITVEENILNGINIDPSSPVSRQRTSVVTALNSDRYNNYITIKNNMIRSGSCGVSWEGYETPEMGNKIEGNIIRDYYLYGIYSANQEGFHVVNNKIIANSSNNSICGMRLWDMTNSLIGNNMISFYGGYGGTYAISTGESSDMNIVYNSIFMDGLFYAGILLDEGVTGINILNNNISCEGGGLVIEVDQEATNGIGLIDHNNYFTTGNPLISWSGKLFKTLPSWILATGRDTNSYNMDPAFLADDSLYTTATLLNNKAKPFPDITTDIYGNPRSFHAPDIGAHEFPNITGVCDAFADFATDSITDTGLKVDWTPGNNTSFYLEYGSAGFSPGSGTMISGTYPGSQPPVYIDSLTADTEYDIYFGELCNSGSDSAYIKNKWIIKTAVPCTPVGAVSLVHVTEDSATFSFYIPAGRNIKTIEYEYGPSGYTQGTGTRGIFGPDAGVGGLDMLMHYDIYVRGNCEDENKGVSDWIGPLTFRTACAGPLSGIYTVSHSGSGERNFMSLESLMYRLENCGIDGPVTVNIAGGMYNEQIVMGEIPGTSEMNRIILQSDPSSATAVEIEYEAIADTTNYIWKFDGADFVTLREVTLTAKNTSYFYGRVMLFTGNSTGLIIEDNILNGITTESPLIHNMVLENYSGTTNTLNHSIIRKNQINGGSIAIHFGGGSNDSETGNSIDSNTINGYSATGIRCAGQDNMSIQGNTIQSLEKSNFNQGGVYGMNLSEHTGLVCVGNTLNVSGLDNLFGISLIETNGDSIPSLIANNMITLSDNAGRSDGIYADNTISTNIIHNSVLITDGSPQESSGMSIVSSGSGGSGPGGSGSGGSGSGGSGSGGSGSGGSGPGGSGSGGSGSGGSGSGGSGSGGSGSGGSGPGGGLPGPGGGPGVSNPQGLKILNNNIVNTVGGVAVEVTAFDTIIQMDYNNYHVTGPNLGLSGTTYVTDLSGWKSVSGLDSNSVSGDPLYVSTTDLHASSPLLAGAGKPFPSVPEDIDGESRSDTAPSIGADELSLDECYSSYNLKVTGVYDNRVELEWMEGAGTSHNIEYDPAGYTPGTKLTGIQGTTYTLTGLSPQTDYDIYMSDYCSSSGDTSSWFGPLAIRTACANALSGVYTINANMPTGGTNFGSFTEAARSLSECGISGPVVFNIAGGIYDEKLLLKDIPGTSAANPVTFQADPSDTAAVVLQDSSSSEGENYIVQLENVSYTTIRDMNIVARGTIYSQVILFKRACHNIVIEDNLIEAGANTLVNDGVIVNDSDGDDHVEHISIRNNTITGGYYSIYWEGGDSDYETGTVIEGNTLKDFLNYGMYCYYQDSLIITGNEISSANGASSTNYGLRLQDIDHGQAIDNKIRVYGTSTNYGLYIRGWNGETTSPAIVANNMVSTLNNTGTTYGVYLHSPNYVDMVYNSILVNAGSATSGHGMYMTSDGSYTRILNNNITVTGPGVAMEISSSATSNLIDMNYNNLYTAGTDLGNWGGTTVSDLAAWQSVSSWDTNSVSGDPYYKAPDNLHFTGVKSIVNGAGTPYSGITTDIDGHIRSTTAPDIGADEGPDCDLSAGLMVDSVSCYNAYLNWTPGLSGAMAIVEYDTVGFVAGTGTMQFTGSPLSISGLDANTMYEVYLSDTCGPDTMATLGPISFTTLPDTTVADYSFTVSPPTLTGQTVDFDAAASTGANTYIWDFGDGSTGSGMNVSHDYTADSIYTVQLIVTGDCSSDTLTQTVTISGISVEENIISRSLEVYPNPTKDRIQVNFETGNSGEVVIRLTDLSGKIVLQRRVSDSNGHYIGEINTGPFAKGTYILRVQGSGMQAVRRIVRQ